MSLTGSKPKLIKFGGSYFSPDAVQDIDTEIPMEGGKLYSVKVRLKNGDEYNLNAVSQMRLDAVLNLFDILEL